ncbi:hypothetical protein [Bradyrhizobium monzae]|uniref:hypothetical protein n=1 Tax=Bradyrhizobium sp. Oc8 TaxID=2876780 RepID=UPI001F44E08F|nr:hypothetical protein [Bradyrhizobium sp. Oc8]
MDSHSTDEEVRTLRRLLAMREAQLAEARNEIERLKNQFVSRTVEQSASTCSR